VLDWFFVLSGFGIGGVNKVSLQDFS